MVDGEFIPRNAGVGDAFFTMSLRLSRAFALGEPVQLEAIAEVFNPTNTVNETGAQRELRYRRVPDAPVSRPSTR